MNNIPSILHICRGREGADQLRNNTISENNARLEVFCFTSCEMYNKIDAAAKNKRHLENMSTTLPSTSGEIFNDTHFTLRKKKHRTTNTIKISEIRPAPLASNLQKSYPTYCEYF